VLLVDRAHQGSGRRQDLVDKDEDGLLRRQLDALADDIDKLSDRQVGRDKVFLLIDGCDVRFLDFLADNLLQEVSRASRRSTIDKELSWQRTTYGNAIGVFLANALGFSLALLEGVLVLKLAVVESILLAWLYLKPR